MRYGCNKKYNQNLNMVKHVKLDLADCCVNLYYIFFVILTIMLDKSSSWPSHPEMT